MKSRQQIIRRVTATLVGCMFLCLALALVASVDAQPSIVSVEYTINANERDAWSGNGHTGNPMNEVRINGYNSTNEPYEFVGNDSDAESAGLEFQIAIPQGASIQSAFISVKAGSFQNTSPTGAMIIHLYDIANAQPFANGFFGDLVNHHPTYAQTVAWPANTTWANGSIQQTPNIATLLQTFVNRTDYIPGNYVGFAVSGGTIQPGRYYGWEDYFANGTPAKLTISYLTSAVATPTRMPASTSTVLPTATRTPSPTTATVVPAIRLPIISASQLPKNERFQQSEWVGSSFRN
jgi:hypothetical protein